MCFPGFDERSGCCSTQRPFAYASGHENAADAPGFAVAQWACPASLEPRVFSNPTLSLALGVIACIFGSLLLATFHDFHALSAILRAPAIGFVSIRTRPRILLSHVVEDACPLHGIDLRSFASFLERLCRGVYFRGFASCSEYCSTQRRFAYVRDDGIALRNLGLAVARWACPASLEPRVFTNPALSARVLI